MEYKGKGIDPAALLYEYHMLCKKRDFTGRLLIFQIFFTTPYFIKPIFYIIKKQFVLPIFLHSKNIIVWRYSVLDSVYFLFCLMYTITHSEYMYAVFVHQTNISYSNGEMSEPVFSIDSGRVVHVLQGTIVWAPDVSRMNYLSIR